MARVAVGLGISLQFTKAVCSTKAMATILPMLTKRIGLAVVSKSFHAITSGFWEGGKGTRNKQLMSRKDPRKYQRREANAPGPSTRK
ncbi:predicted protein [Uncinocarpus reesii 1704]|uniref:Uncharacterized protein n=1 Tax=Uncinocarpus reesii (strain UAMH 1704) TaxID=336963 RepID=C4JGV8_UNCRE|nr:uncharacterized protein UREG_01209 [Uncinocarpus reesii 1704]EEP76360.1 predicted protein [Uncinocarpus reesii 1704]